MQVREHDYRLPRLCHAWLHGEGRWSVLTRAQVVRCSLYVHLKPVLRLAPKFSRREPAEHSASIHKDLVRSPVSRTCVPATVGTAVRARFSVRQALQYGNDSPYYAVIALKMGLHLVDHTLSDLRVKG